MIKKINAVLSLLLTALLILHAGYECAAYCLFYYNPMLSKVTGFVTASVVALHVIISIISLFVLHDSRSVIYIRLNMKTVIQRICAVIMAVLLPVHIYAFNLLQRYAGKTGYFLTEAGQILFYAAVFGHIAVSFTKSLITLGVMEKDTVRRKADTVISVICTLLFIVVAVITVTTHTKLFLR